MNKSCGVNHVRSFRPIDKAQRFGDGSRVESAVGDHSTNFNRCVFNGVPLVNGVGQPHPFLPSNGLANDGLPQITRRPSAGFCGEDQHGQLRESKPLIRVLHRRQVPRLVIETVWEEDTGNGVSLERIEECIQAKFQAFAIDLNLEKAISKTARKGCMCSLFDMKGANLIIRKDSLCCGRHTVIDSDDCPFWDDTEHCDQQILFGEEDSEDSEIDEELEKELNEWLMREDD